MTLFDLPPSFNPRAPAPAPEGNTPSWFTPLNYFLERERRLIEARLIAGPFDLDPCGHPEAPVSQEILRRGGMVFTSEENGLLRPWRGHRPFINAPFDAESMERFLGILRIWWERAEIAEAVVHCPAWTDRGWWHQHIEPDRRAGRVVVWFEPGRQLYGWPGNPTGEGGDTAKFPSALVVWRCP